MRSNSQLPLSRYLFSALLSIGLLLPSFSLAQLDLSFFEMPARSSINNAAISLPDSGWSYTFMTTGHLYGAHENRQSIYPAASFLANVDMINGHTPTVFIATGDIVRSAKDSLATQAWQSAGKLLKAPIYNAPGNHDLDDEAAYRKAFGSPQTSFFIRDDLFLILNTEYLREGKPEKLSSFIERESEKVTKRAQPVRHLFVFSHRMLAPLCNPELASMDDLANEPFRDKTNVDDACKVYRALAKIPHTGEFWHFSGDVGTHWSVPVLYEFDKKNQCHILASGVGDTPEDRLAMINVSYEGKVTAEIVPLFPGGETTAAAGFTPEFWQETDRLGEIAEIGLGDRIMNQLGKVGFWAGALLGVLLTLVGLLILKGFQRNMTA